MEPNVVFDASVVLAIFFDEPGTKETIDKLPYAVLHTVNLCEASTVFQYKGIPEKIAEQKLRELFLIIVPMTTELAFFDGYSIYKNATLWFIFWRQDVLCSCFRQKTSFTYSR